MPGNGCSTPRQKQMAPNTSRSAYRLSTRILSIATSSMESRIQIRGLYAIVDKGCLPQSVSVIEFAEELIRGGATLLQYRNKTGNAREILSDLRDLKRVVNQISKTVSLIVNDRADFCVA